MRKEVHELHDLRDAVRRERLYLFNQFFVLHDVRPIQTYPVSISLGVPENEPSLTVGLLPAFPDVARVIN